jgi:hypothetical protein
MYLFLQLASSSFRRKKKKNNEKDSNISIIKHQK